MPQIIAAFDLASVTGCCDGPVGGKPRLWSWYLKDAGDSRPARLDMLHRFVSKYFEIQRVDAIVYEAPLNIAVMGRIGAQEATVAFLRGAIGVLEQCCYAHGKPVAAVGVQKARSSVLGWSRNQSGTKTKRRVLEEVSGRLPGCERVENDNEADAYVIWAYACALQNPRLAVGYTPLFAGAPS